MLCEGFFDRNRPHSVRRGVLPHLRQDGGTYFVTFRLSDSLPQVALNELRRLRELWIRAFDEGRHDQLNALEMEQRRRAERWLDRGYGSCILREPQAREIVTRALHYFAGNRYELGRFTVAANHVHSLLRTALGVDLSEIMASWKRHTSREIGKLPELRRKVDSPTHLWQVESFDHLVRDQASCDKFDAYIRNHDRVR